MTYRAAGYLVGAGRGLEGFGLGETPVRTRFPSGPDAGDLADRYSSYRTVPLLAAPFAQQLGTAGFWYVPADWASRTRDTVDRAGDAAITGIDATRQAAENFVAGAGKWLILGALGYVLFPAIAGAIRGKR